MAQEPWNRSVFHAPKSESDSEPEAGADRSDVVVSKPLRSVSVDPTLRDIREVSCFDDLMQAGLIVGTYPDNEARTVTVPADWKKPVDFVARVGGDSMKGYVNDGEYAAFTRATSAKERDVVAVLVEGQILLKGYQKVNGKFCLVSTNPKYKPIPFPKDAQILAICHGAFPDPDKPRKKAK